MPRPRKCRRVCSLPNDCGFHPLKTMENNDSIQMTVEEYETIRLIDFLDYTQEDCAVQMEVARTTIQKLYTDARRKIADALVNQKSLIVGGGHFKLCSAMEKPCSIAEKSCCSASTPYPFAENTSYTAKKQNDIKTQLCPGKKCHAVNKNRQVPLHTPATNSHTHA